MNKAKSKSIDWYIKGKYHCDKCPFCWGGEYLPGCDDYDDCGCYIFGDLRDSCRLIPPIRFILGWGKRKKMQYIKDHEYDDYGEWVEKRMKQESDFQKAFREEIGEKYAICQKDRNGEPHTVDAKPYFLEEDCYIDSVMRLYFRADEILNPPKSYETLRKKWSNLIKETWRKFIGIFKPYFCK